MDPNRGGGPHLTVGGGPLQEVPCASGSTLMGRTTSMAIWSQPGSPVTIAHCSPTEKPFPLVWGYLQMITGAVLFHYSGFFTANLSGQGR